VQPLEEIVKSERVLYQVRFSEREDRTQIIPRITTPNPLQEKYFNMVGIKNPLSLENIVCSPSDRGTPHAVREYPPHDPWMTIADFRSYADAQARATAGFPEEHGVFA
jgi:hypothetical protein